MPDHPSIEDLQARLRDFRDEREWGRFHTLKDLAAAIAIEALARRKRVRLHADLTILAKLACALARARAVPLAA